MLYNDGMSTTSAHQALSPGAPAQTPTTSSPEQPTASTARVKTTRPLTRKQKALVQHIVNNPKDSATKAYKQVYGTTSDKSASVNASRTLAKPNVLAELVKHSNTAESVLIDVLTTSQQEMRIAERDRAQWAVNARQTADSILDRIHGKATQRIEQQSTAVQINIDLTGVSTASEQG